MLRYGLEAIKTPPIFQVAQGGYHGFPGRSSINDCLGFLRGCLCDIPAPNCPEFHGKVPFCFISGEYKNLHVRIQMTDKFQNQVG